MGEPSLAIIKVCLSFQIAYHPSLPIIQRICIYDAAMALQLEWIEADLLVLEQVRMHLLQYNETLAYTLGFASQCIIENIQSFRATSRCTGTSCFVKSVQPVH